MGPRVDPTLPDSEDFQPPPPLDPVLPGLPGVPNSGVQVTVPSTESQTSNHGTPMDDLG